MKRLAIVLALLASCSGSEKERTVEDRKHEDLKKPYTVVDASSDYRPGWIEDARLWAKDHDYDTQTHRYFSFETAPKNGRTIACNLARANVRAGIAAEISTSIESKLTAFSEGFSSASEYDDEVRPLREFAESVLTEKIRTSVVGAEVVKTYWEHRKYRRELGSEKDFSAWTCSVFVRMAADRLQRLVESANKLVIERTKNAALKERVKQALNKEGTE